MSRSDLDLLSDRQRRILHALCREYVLTGRAVSSLSLVKRHRLEWSSATVRAELARLEGDGYLQKPHAAAGRFPTAKGLVVYLEGIRVDGRPRPEHQRALDLTIGRERPRSAIRGAARVLSELVGCVGIGFLGTPCSDVFSRVELVGLSGSQAMVVLGTRDGGRCVRRVALATPLEAQQLPRLEGHLRSLIVGRTFRQARDHLQLVMSEHEAHVDALLAEALRLGTVLCGSAYLDPLSMQVVGQATLASSPRRQADLSQLLELLEDYHQLAQVLCQLLPEQDGRARVRLELPWAAAGPVGAGLTLVGCRLPLAASGELRTETGALAVLGPDSMDFEAVIPLVEYAAKALLSRA